MEGLEGGNGGRGRLGLPSCEGVGKEGSDQEIWVRRELGSQLAEGGERGAQVGLGKGEFSPSLNWV